jgi:hypothetical protein
MSAIDKAALALTKCRTCLGCNLLDDDSFRGDNDCLNYRKAPADVLVERRYEKENDDERTWRP